MTVNLRFNLSPVHSHLQHLLIEPIDDSPMLIWLNMMMTWHVSSCVIRCSVFSITMA